MQQLIPYLILINALSFLIMLADKFRAKNKMHRIPEAVLMGIAGIGGSVGAFVAMHLVRHKTRHPKFAIGLPVMMVIHGILFYFLYF